MIMPRVRRIRGGNVNDEWSGAVERSGGVGQLFFSFFYFVSHVSIQGAFCVLVKSETVNKIQLFFNLKCGTVSNLALFLLMELYIWYFLSQRYSSIQTRKTSLILLPGTRWKHIPIYLSLFCSAKWLCRALWHGEVFMGLYVRHSSGFHWVNLVWIWQIFEPLRKTRVAKIDDWCSFVFACIAWKANIIGGMVNYNGCCRDLVDPKFIICIKIWNWFFGRNFFFKKPNFSFWCRM